jgi:hypothetical protein
MIKLEDNLPLDLKFSFVISSEHVTCCLWDCRRNSFLFFIQRIWLSVLCCSQYSFIFCLYISLFLLLPLSFSAVCIRKVNLVAVWETARHWLCQFFTWLTLSIPWVGKCMCPPFNVCYGSMLLNKVFTFFADPGGLNSM